MTNLLLHILIFIATYCVARLVLDTFFQMSPKPKDKEEFLLQQELSRYVKPEQLRFLQLSFGAGGMALVILLLLFCSFLFKNNIPLFMIFAAGALAFVGGYYLTCQYYCRKVQQRRELVEQGLLDAIISLANSMKAGMSLGQGLETVARHTQGPLGEEFQQVLREQRLGWSMLDALNRFAERNPYEDVRLLVSSITLSSRTGGSLVEILADLIAMIRQRRELALKLQTMTASGLLQARILALAPFLVAVILFFVNPEFVRPLFTTPLGWGGIGIILLLIFFGYFSLKRIVTIEL